MYAQSWKLSAIKTRWPGLQHNVVTNVKVTMVMDVPDVVEKELMVAHHGRMWHMAQMVVVVETSHLEHTLSKGRAFESLNKNT